MDDAVRSLHQQIESAAGGLAAPVSVQVKRDVPSASLLEFSGEVDLLVVGSRRWGPIARLLLGGTGKSSTNSELTQVDEQLFQAIMGFVCVIGVCYAIEMLMIRPQWSSIAFHTLVPMLDGKSVYVAVSMLGATVMPHVIYLHSALVQPRLREEKERAPTPRHRYIARLRHLRYEAIDVFAAMNAAWLVNSAMIVVAAAAFAGKTLDNPIEDAHRMLGPLLGEASAVVFAVALLCSGLSSSTVGTMAGQVIIEGFLEIKFSIFLRRLLTLIPAIAVIASGLDPLKILVLSQVVLSFTLPFALIPLLILTGKQKVMGAFVNQRITHWLGWLTVTIVVALNLFLLWQSIAA